MNDSKQLAYAALVGVSRARAQDGSRLKTQSTGAAKGFPNASQHVEGRREPVRGHMTLTAQCEQRRWNEVEAGDPANRTTDDLPIVIVGLVLHTSHHACHALQGERRVLILRRGHRQVAGLTHVRALG